MYEFRVQGSVELGVIMQLKRWAFVPFVTLVCVAVACRLLTRGTLSLGSVLVGVMVAAVAAILIDRRRTRSRELGLRPPL